MIRAKQSLSHVQGLALESLGVEEFALPLKHQPKIAERIRDGGIVIPKDPRPYFEGAKMQRLGLGQLAFTLQNSCQIAKRGCDCNVPGTEQLDIQDQSLTMKIFRLEQVTLMHQRISKQMQSVSVGRAFLAIKGTHQVQISASHLFRFLIMAQ